MKIAITYDNGQIFQHFGRTEKFKIYDVDNGEIKESFVVDTDGQGHGALAEFLRQKGVDALICGGIGGGARELLSQEGIKIYGGASGSCDEAANALFRGTLLYNPDVQCSHHEEHHGGECRHSCHGDKHGCR